MKNFQVACFVLLVLFQCQSPTSDTPDFQIPFEKYTLDNGLEVILHQDKSDPIVAVATLVHVGSNREVPGKTGFAHFFEHMSFNDSENVPRGANRKMIPELGGQRNGGTWSDGTVYYEVVPKDAFEKIMWIDSDRLGFMINTVTEAALEREKQVVKNEKRQNYDNRPYGRTTEMIRATLYPADHPYNWTTIGSLPDLQAATLEDVKEFYEQFYGANNATLVIAGDIDFEETRQLVEKWFGEIRRGPEVKPLSPRNVVLEETRSVYYEDNFAKLPEIRLTFPSIQQYHPDSYALEALADILASSKDSPLYKVVVEESKLAPEVYTYQNSNELTGEFVIRIRGNEGTDLDDVKGAIEASLSRFEEEGFSQEELDKIKAINETALYNDIATVLNKAFQLATYNEYAGDPGFVTQDAASIQAVTKADVMRVYNQYIKDQPSVISSVVPKGQTELTVEGARLAELYEEEVIAGKTEEEVSQGKLAEYEKTITKEDRSEPDLGEAALIKSPKIWEGTISNGLRVYGTEISEVPLVNFDLTIDGGHLLDPLSRSGTASLLGQLMMEGTANRTSAELEKALGLLGANVTISTGNEAIRISGNTLSRNFDKVVALVAEILLSPRWDVAQFDRLKQEALTRIKGNEGNAVTIAFNAFYRQLYGSDHIFGTPVIGTENTVNQIELDDLQTFFKSNLSPTVSRFHVAGAISQREVLSALSSLEPWKAVDVVQPPLPEVANDKGERVFFVNVPKAKQSAILAGKLVVDGSHPDFNNIGFANTILGGGASGRLFQLLRIEKGYTYGAYAFTRDYQTESPYIVYTNVRANATGNSLELIRDQLENYQATFRDREMEITKNKVIKDATRAFESLNAKLNVLRQVSKYGKPHNYVELDQQELVEMELEDFHQYINTYLNESEMFYMVVGDAETQLEAVEQLGYGQPILLDIYGNPVNNKIELL